MAAYRPIHCGQEEGHPELQGGPPEYIFRLPVLFGRVQYQTFLMILAHVLIAER